MTEREIFLKKIEIEEMLVNEPNVDKKIEILKKVREQYPDLVVHEFENRFESKTKEN